jgi:colicin import membrane protein
MNSSVEIIEFSSTEITAFSEFEFQLAELKKDNSSLQFDYQDAKGNKEARSHIYKLRQTKSALESARKIAKEKALAYGKRVDTKAKEISAEIEGMIEVHAAPLKEIEEKEAARVNGIKLKIESLHNYKEFEHDCSASMWADELAAVEAFVLDDSLAEFKADAAIQKDAALAEIKQRLDARQKYEDEQAELVKLREQQADQERKDRERKIAEDAETRANIEAQQEAARVAKAAEDETKRIADEHERSELKRAAELETAKREKAEAEERAEKAERLAKEKAERDQQEAIRLDLEASQKREANKKHQAKINNAAVSGLVDAGVTEEMAKLAITAIAKKQVPAVQINY